MDLDTLAFLYMASLLGWIPGELTGKILSSVAFPILSRVVRERPQELKLVARKIRTLQAICSIPIFILLSLISQPLIDVLYDVRYAPAGTFLKILALNGAIGVLPMVYQNAILSLGQSKIHAFVMGISSALKISATISGFYIAGPIGMVIGVGFAELVTFGLSFSFAKRWGYASFSTRRHLPDLHRPRLCLRSVDDKLEPV